MDILESIRNGIQAESEGRLGKEQIFNLMGKIDVFKQEHHYLPNDISEWYDGMDDFIFRYNEALGGDWEG